MRAPLKSGGDSFGGNEPISTATVNGSQMLFTFATLPGVHYRLQKSTNLADWHDAGPVTTGDGSVQQFVTDVDDPQAFFRVAASPL